MSPKRTTRAFRVELPAHTMRGLMSTIDEEWRKKGFGTPMRFQYSRGEPLLIERSSVVDTEESSSLSVNEGDLMSPFGIAHHQTDFEVLHSEQGSDAVHLLIHACHILRRRNTPPRYVVCRDIVQFSSWIGGGSTPPEEIPGILGLRVVVDVDMDPGLEALVCGSAVGDMVYEVERAVAIKEAP